MGRFHSGSKQINAELKIYRRYKTGWEHLPQSGIKEENDDKNRIFERFKGKTGKL